MADIPQGSKESDRLIEFLIEDLKETGAHLRDTDRKLSLLIQVYGGAFVLIATLSVNRIINIEELLGFPGLILSLILTGFTWWLFIYSLKSKEHKAIYIRRMNFLRREMHYFLNNKYKDLPGYWTDLEIKEDSNRILPRKLYRVGLDDLYPAGLRGVIAIFGLSSVLILGKILYGNPSWNIPDIHIVGDILIYFAIAGLILLFTNRQSQDADQSIKRKIEVYKHTSEENDQKEQLERSQKTIKEYARKAQRRVKE